MGEDFLECLVMETADRVKSAILGCASFGHQDMDMGVEVDAVAESLDNSHNTRHKLKTCGCVEKLHKCASRIETERIEEFAFEAEKKTQHLGHGEDDLAGGHPAEAPLASTLLIPPDAWHGRTRGSCRRTSTAAPPHSRDIGCGQARTSDYRSSGSAQPPPG